MINKKLLIKFFTFLGGIYFFLEFYLPEKFLGLELSLYNDPISLSLRIIGAMALGLGLINILMIHVPRVIFLKKNMVNSFGLLLGLGLMLCVSIADWWSQESYIKPANHFAMLSEYSAKLATLNPEEQLSGFALLQASYQKVPLVINSNQPQTIAIENLDTQLKVAKVELEVFLQETKPKDQLYFETLATKLNVFSGVYRQLLTLEYQEFFIYQFNLLIYEGLFVALGSAMFALLGFYVASAAYRAFRIRSFESGLMMLAAIIVMLGQIPFGVWLWDGFPVLRLWLLEVPNSAAFRGIALGAGVASLIMALRMWLSLETDYTQEDSSQ